MKTWGEIPEKPDGHRCPPKGFAYTDSAQAGPAVNYCFEAADDGSFWAGNAEYESQVNFCPFCGEKAKVETEMEVPEHTKDH